MCGLCGVLGGREHWSESASAPAAFAGRAEAQTRMRERQARTRILNTVLKYHGVVAKDWSGSAYLLTGSTGRTEIVNSVGDIWAAVERISKRPCDPLDENYLGLLSSRAR